MEKHSCSNSTAIAMTFHDEEEYIVSGIWSEEIDDQDKAPKECLECCSVEDKRVRVGTK